MTSRRKNTATQTVVLLKDHPRDSFKDESFLRFLFDCTSYLCMEKRKGDEHLHHPICEVCQKEFNNTHELSVHVDKAHRNQGT